MTMIIKPEASCQGKGIYLIRDLDDIVIDEHCVIQEYINKPFLMEKMKFDLRLYVLVVGIDPLRVYLSKEGLARLSTKQYEEVDDANVEDMTMHLTNYAINKHSTKFQQNRAAILDSVGHKRSLKYSLKYIEREEGYDKNVIMDEVKDIIMKTLICGQPIVSEAFKSCQLDDFENSMCFEILGFDIMLDEKAKPYLLEVNHSPSFSTDSPLDEKIKGELIRDTIRLLGLTRKRKAMYKRNMQMHLDHRIMNGKFLRVPQQMKDQFKQEFEAVRNEYEPQNLGSFEQIYPCQDNPAKMQEYERYLKASKKVYMNRDNRYGSKVKRRLTHMSQNQQIVPKSISPQKKGKAVNIVAENAASNFQTPQRQGDPNNNKQLRRLHTTETNLNNVQAYAHQLATVQMQVSKQQYQQQIEQLQKANHSLAFQNQMNGQQMQTTKFQHITNNNQRQINQSFQPQQHKKTGSNVTFPNTSLTQNAIVMAKANMNQKTIPEQDRKLSVNEEQAITQSMAIQQQIIHRSPSPKGRQVRMNYGPHSNQAMATGLQIGNSSIQNNLNHVRNSQMQQMLSEQQNTQTTPVHMPTNKMQLNIQERMIGQNLQTVNHEISPNGQLMPAATLDSKSKANLEFGTLSPEILDQLDPETLAKIQEIQQQISALPNSSVQQMNQVYRIGVLKGRKNIEDSGKSLPGVNRQESQMSQSQAQSWQHSLQTQTQDQSNRFNLTTTNHQVIHSVPGSSVQKQRLESNPNNMNINQSGAHSSTNSAIYQTKRESYNFISQKNSNPNVTSQDKMRRNLSREYCPMIIKSTNKNIQAARPEIIKGVLNSSNIQQKVESGQKRSSYSAASKPTVDGQQQNVSNSSQALIQMQSPDKKNEKMQILKNLNQLGEQSMKVGNQHIINAPQSQTINNKSADDLLEDDEKEIQKVVELVHNKFVDDGLSQDGGLEQQDTEQDDEQRMLTFQPQLTETPVMYKKVTEKRIANGSQTNFGEVQVKSQSTNLALENHSELQHHPVEAGQHYKNISLQKSTDVNKQRPPSSVVGQIRSPHQINEQKKPPFHIRDQNPIHHSSNLSGKPNSLQASTPAHMSTKKSRMANAAIPYNQNQISNSHSTQKQITQYKLVKSSGIVKNNQRGQSNQQYYQQTSSPDHNSYQRQQPYSNVSSAQQQKKRTFSQNKPGAQSSSVGLKQDGGEYLRPKVLDFQPKMGQVDPLLANRGRKRGMGAGGQSHNHAPTINQSSHQGIQSRFHGNSGVFRNFQ